MDKTAESHPLIILNGWEITQGPEFATLKVKAPLNISGVILIEYISGPAGSKATWHTGTGTGTVNSARMHGSADVEPGADLIITGYQVGGAPLGPTDNPQANGTNKADTTFGPEGTRMTINITVPGVGDEAPTTQN